MQSQINILKDLKKFRKAVSLCWGKDTAHKSCIDIARKGKSVGQCGVTAMLLGHYLENKFPGVTAKVAIGKVVSSDDSIIIDYHCWNVVEGIDNKIWNIDLTLDQALPNQLIYFDKYQNPDDENIVYKVDRYSTKEGPTFLNRYSTLKERFDSLENHLCENNLDIHDFLQIGKGKAGALMIIGEAPAPNGWRKSGKAFMTTDGKVVPTGKNLQNLLWNISPDLSIKDISFTEITKCVVGNERGKLKVCASKTWPHFLNQVSFAKPKMLIILGQKTTEIFCSLALCELEIGQMRKVNLCGRDYPILSIYHTSPLNPRRVLNDSIIAGYKSSIDEILNS